jgi:hypothetical protein
LPELKEYVNTQGLAPTDRGTEARTMEGRRIGQFFNQRAESLRDFANRAGTQIGSAIRDAGNVAVDYQTHRQISQGIATYAEIQDGIINEWNGIAKNSDPNDPSVRQKFLESVTPRLQTWADTFTTEGSQKWAQGRVNALLDHMYEKTAADTATRAGQALENNFRTFSNTQTNSAYNDPSGVPHLIENGRVSFDTMVDTSNVKGVEAGKAKTELFQKHAEEWARAGGIGAVEKAADPVAAAEQYINKRWKQNGETVAMSQYLSEAAQERIRAHAKEQERARQADENHARVLANQDKKNRSDELEQNYLDVIQSKDPNKRLDDAASKIASDHELLPETRIKLRGLIDRETKPETNNRVSAQTTVDLLRKLREPNADLDKLMNAAWDARLKDPGLGGSLTERDFNTVRTEILGRKTPEGADLSRDRGEFFKRYAPTIDSAMVLGEHSQAGAQAMYFAEMDARRQEGVLRQKGIDPHELYDPRSQYFFGRKENLEKYNRSLAEVMKDRANALKSGPQVTQPPAFRPMVETPASFKERFGFDAAATVTSKSDYDKLPSGTEFVSNGKRYIKP